MEYGLIRQNCVDSNCGVAGVIDCHAEVLGSNPGTTHHSNFFLVISFFFFFFLFAPKGVQLQVG